MSVASTAVSPGSRNPGVPRNDAVGLSGTSREEAERPSRPEPEGRFLSSSTEKPTRDVFRAYVLRMPGGWDPPEIGGQDSGSVSRGGAAAFGCDVGPAFPGGRVRPLKSLDAGSEAGRRRASQGLRRIQVGPVGLEPTTRGLEVRAWRPPLMIGVACNGGA